MLSKTIKYTDYNGVEREEKFLFNLSKAELMEMEYGTTGGLAETIRKIIQTTDTPSIIAMFKDLVLKAYGEKSADGKRFIKIDENGRKLCMNFAQTEAYSNLFMELATNADAAANFVKGILPADVEIPENIDINNLDNITTLPEANSNPNA